MQSKGQMLNKHYLHNAKAFADFGEECEQKRSHCANTRAQQLTSTKNERANIAKWIYFISVELG